MDGIRRIVSGKKARFTDGELDLDLVQLTDRVILMGYPASGEYIRDEHSSVFDSSIWSNAAASTGLAALYRNQR